MTAHPDPTRLARFGLDPAERRALLAHVGACAACRSRLAFEDPACLFALLGSVAPPPEALERLSQRIASALPPATTVQTGRRRLMGALAAAVVLAAILSGVLWRSDAPPSTTAEFPPSAIMPAIEIHAPQSAQLLGLTVGDTQLILIFDEGLEL